MANYFDKFPLVSYNIDRTKFGVNEYTAATNIMVRLRVVREKLNAVFHYYEYTIKAFERPDIIAENVYGNSELHWLVLLTNDIIDPLYGWPLDYDQFENYLANKYRQSSSQSNADAIAYAKTNIHHYEKILKITNTRTNETTEKRMIITETEYNDLSLPLTEPAPQVITVGSDIMYIYEWKTSQTYYDWEDAANEKKRNIKLIKPAYIQQIMYEFDTLMKAANPSLKTYSRRLT